MTQSSTISNLRGRIVLANVRFSDGSGTKRRPAIVMSTEEYHAGRSDAIVVAVTTRISPVRSGDHLLTDWQSAGLPRPSLAKGFVETLERTTFVRVLGTVSQRDLVAIEAGLRHILGL